MTDKVTSATYILDGMVKRVAARREEFNKSASLIKSNPLLNESNVGVS